MVPPVLLILWINLLQSVTRFMALQLSILMLALSELFRFALNPLSDNVVRGWVRPAPELYMPFTLIPLKQPTMLLTDFKAKLRRIDTRLYIDHSNPVKKENGLRFAPLYLKRARRDQVSIAKADRNLVHAGHAKYLDALESGVMDTYVTAICLDFIPEYDIFNKEYTKLAIMGWRSIGLVLANQKIASIDRIRKALNCQGLGQSDYDKLDLFGKLEFAKRLDDGNI